MTALDLDAIEAAWRTHAVRCDACDDFATARCGAEDCALALCATCAARHGCEPGHESHPLHTSDAAIPALIAEVRRLRAQIAGAT